MARGTMTQQSHLRHFVFTINNPDCTPPQLWEKLSPKAKYLIFQLEKGENGTPHFQGYCELTRRTRFNPIKALIPTAHIEPRRGSQAQAKEYASKADTRVEGPFEFGEFIENEPGKRNDVIAFRDAILAGKRKRELLEEFPSSLQRYPRFVEFCRSTQPPAPRDNLQVVLLWGEPGTGKTRYVYDNTNIDELYKVPIGKDLWFDGYDGQGTLLMDDFTGEMRLAHLLQLLDRYPMQVPVKGSFTDLKATTIYVTSNKHPKDWYDWYKHGDIRYRALMRRFHKIAHFTDTITWSSEEGDALPIAPPVEELNFGLVADPEL